MYGDGSWDDSFDLLVGRFISAIWRSLVPREANEHDDFLQDEEERAVWSEIYTIYCASRSCIGEKLTPKSFSDHILPWKQKCRSKFPDPKLATLLEKLFSLEDTLGLGVREPFPRADEV